MATLSVAAPPSVRERYAGLLQGALAADALALAPHWIYDQDELARSFGRVTDLLAPPEGSYHVGKGRGAQTHYGDQTLVLMESLDACGGTQASATRGLMRCNGPGRTTGADRLSPLTERRSCCASVRSQRSWPWPRQAASGRTARRRQPPAPRRRIVDACSWRRQGSAHRRLRHC